MAKVMYVKKKSLKEQLLTWVDDNADEIALSVVGVVVGGACCGFGYLLGRADGYHRATVNIGSAAADVLDSYIDKCGFHGAEAMAEYLGANLEKINWAEVEDRYLRDGFIKDRIAFVEELKRMCGKK